MNDKTDKLLTALLATVTLVLGVYIFPHNPIVGGFICILGIQLFVVAFDKNDNRFI